MEGQVPQNIVIMKSKKPLAVYILADDPTNGGFPEIYRDRIVPYIKDNIMEGRWPAAWTNKELGVSAVLKHPAVSADEWLKKNTLTFRPVVYQKAQKPGYYGGDSSVAGGYKNIVISLVRSYLSTRGELPNPLEVPLESCFVLIHCYPNELPSTTDVASWFDKNKDAFEFHVSERQFKYMRK